MINIFSISTNELVAKIREGEISSVEVCKAYIERINKFEKDVKAWSFFDKKILLEKAAESDDLRKSGKPLGPLHGLPIAVKDIFGTYDMPTECGTVFRKKMSASQDSEVVNLLKNAGAIIMGKTVTAELAYIHPGKTTNPHDYTRTPGGSSSGSAAVIAAQMAPLSVGSQTGGSIIRPASYCGIVGYKPSYGLISRSGVLKTSEKLDTIGVFGKSVEDVALLARSIIKKDLYDPATVHFAADNILEASRKNPVFEPKFIFYKTDKWKSFKESVFLTAKTTAMIMWLFIGSWTFSSVFSYLGGHEVFEHFFKSMDLAPWQFLVITQIIIFLLGWPLEWTEILIIFVPIFLPLLEVFGVNPYFFAMLIALNLQTSFLTPPMAMSAYYLKGVQSKNVELMQIFSGIMPFLGIVIFAMVLMYWFPGIALWLPEVLFAD